MPQEELNIINAELARRELARRSFPYYLSYATPGWIPTRFANFLAAQVQSFIQTDTGNAFDILIIETPPQHGKSMTITEAFPAWYMGNHPNNRVIVASYNEETANRFARRNKDKINATGMNLFGHAIGDVNQAATFELDNHRGAMISRGILSGITGNPANLIIIDDPIKNRVEADSETIRARVWEEWQNSIKSRLAAQAKVIVIMTPWHEDDLAARILAKEHNVTLLRLPVEAELDDPMGRSPGEPLCPELGKDAKWLEDFKRSYIRDPDGGARAWAALYQCSPRVEEGNIIRRSWWKFYNPNEIKVFGAEIISVDATFKDKDDNDFVAISVWGKRRNDYYCQYMMNAHLNFLATLQAIRTVRSLYPRAMTVLIEDKANGSAIINVLQQEMFCIPVNPRGGKVARVNAVSAAIESGHTYLPMGAPWVEPFIDQFSAFPNAPHDDMVDSASQALTYLLYSTGEVDVPELPEYEQNVRREEKAFLDNDTLFNPYEEETAWQRLSSPAQ